MNRLLMVLACLALNPTAYSEAVSSSTVITATFKNVPPVAQAAFNQAVEIWERCLDTRAEIKINVRGIERGPTGFAIPRMVRNEPFLPLAETWYPSALANALRGKRDNEDDDMNIFLSLRPNWFYATKTDPDKTIAPDQVDYVNVALHEIAHGLGISSGSFIPWQGEPIASIGYPNEYLNFFEYTFALPELDGTPQIYDRYIRTHNDKALLEFPNPSAELAQALRAPGIYFNGDEAFKTAGQTVEVMPGNISHIPLQTGRPTPIMLADSGKGESVHQLDRLLLAMLSDIGWPVSDACRSSD